VKEPQPFGDLMEIKARGVDWCFDLPDIIVAIVEGKIGIDTHLPGHRHEEERGCPLVPKLFVNLSRFISIRCFRNVYGRTFAFRSRVICRRADEITTAHMRTLGITQQVSNRRIRSVNSLPVEGGLAVSKFAYQIVESHRQ